MSLGRFTFGVLVGGAIGAVVGILMAPRSGIETRDMIQDELEKRYEDTAEKVKETVKVGSDRVKAGTSDLSERVRELTEEFEESGRKALASVKEPVESLRSRLTPDKG